MPRFSPTTQQVLSEASWTPGRTISSKIPQLATFLTNLGFTFHDRAGEFLSEFGQLELDVPVNGHPHVRGFVHFNPVWVARFLDAREGAEGLRALIPRPFCPIGTTSGHSVFILMDDQGATYLLDRDISVFAPLASTTPQALELLCDGRNGRVDSMLLVDGSPSKHILREGNEQAYWGLEAFPDLREFLPPASLEPARRPPTVHAMPRTVQKTITQGRLQREQFHEIQITNGGFCAGLQGEFFFAAHTENVLAIRQAAPFRASSLPPGLPDRRIRTGECIPFQPPAEWTRRM